MISAMSRPDAEAAEDCPLPSKPTSSRVVGAGTGGLLAGTTVRVDVGSGVGCEVGTSVGSAVGCGVG
eukprot:CAMPEP_0171949942 /NCGR_PEP_ID=MMETSP0993-20121228/76705_1 /TAXON_ID=483369 /ORGANISM="non described non described, Strain CCMP2098" /LENGTH=66 /DNA_ID=CAMNT_0012594605 /DNA_START=97 /DNA_END=294 /DNA_ORIENTATION=+